MGTEFVTYFVGPDRNDAGPLIVEGKILSTEDYTSPYDFYEKSSALFGGSTLYNAGGQVKAATANHVEKLGLSNHLYEAGPRRAPEHWEGNRAFPSKDRRGSKPSNPVRSYTGSSEWINRHISAKYHHAMTGTRPPPEEAYDDDGNFIPHEEHQTSVKAGVEYIDRFLQSNRLTSPARVVTSFSGSHLLSSLKNFKKPPTNLYIHTKRYISSSTNPRTVDSFAHASYSVAPEKFDPTNINHLLQHHDTNVSSLSTYMLDKDPATKSMAQKAFGVSSRDEFVRRDALTQGDDYEHPLNYRNLKAPIVAHHHSMLLHMPPGTHAAPLTGITKHPLENEVLIGHGHIIKLNTNPDVIHRRVKILDKDGKVDPTPDIHVVHYLWRGNIVGRMRPDQLRRETLGKRSTSTIL